MCTCCGTPGCSASCSAQVNTALRPAALAPRLGGESGRWQSAQGNAALRVALIACRRVTRPVRVLCHVAPKASGRGCSGWWLGFPRLIVPPHVRLESG